MEVTSKDRRKKNQHSWRSSNISHSKHGVYCKFYDEKLNSLILVNGKQTSSSEETKLITSIFA